MSNWRNLLRWRGGLGLRELRLREGDDEEKDLERELVSEPEEEREGEEEPAARPERGDGRPRRGFAMAELESEANPSR